jgi:hypothetical protein
MFYLHILPLTIKQGGNYADVPPWITLFLADIFSSLFIEVVLMKLIRYYQGIKAE